MRRSDRFLFLENLPGALAMFAPTGPDMGPGVQLGFHGEAASRPMEDGRGR